MPDNDGLAVKVSRKVGVLLEYGFMSVDYGNGLEGAERFEFKGTLKGPLLGVGIRFRRPSLGPPLAVGANLDT